MPIDLAVPHALLVADSSGVRVVARSPDFPSAWEPTTVQLVEGFGPRPEGVAVPAALAVLPFEKAHTAVVQFADHAGGLAFRVLVLNRKLSHAISDPFAVHDAFPPNWSARDSLPQLSWTPDPTPARTVAEVAEILHHDGPLLLGATQALIDGARVLISSPSPDTVVLRRIWKLLPYSTRTELAVATFAFGADRRFQLSFSPNPPDKLPFGTLNDEHCRDVPEGLYELALQVAAETENQAEIDRLFTRRSSGDTLKLALALAGLMLLGLLASKLFF